MFRAGVEEAVSVTIFNAVEDTRVQLQLSVKGEIVAHSHGTVRGESYVGGFTYLLNLVPKDNVCGAKSLVLKYVI